MSQTCIHIYAFTEITQGGVKEEGVIFRYGEELLLILAAARHTEPIGCLEIASSHILSKANGHKGSVKAASPGKNFTQMPLYVLFP